MILARTFFSKHIKPSEISRGLRNSTVGSIALLSIAALIICFRTLQSKHAWLSDKPISEEVFYHQPVHPAKGLENEEFRRLLHAALPALTPSQRTVFLLRYKEELALKDIACRLGRSIGTVKAHLFHAHRTLRHQLLSYFEFGL